ncbi:MAG: phosphatase PAP2 family protein [Chloroflexota bacterium]|nr:phosphatase PAP2 family protein [Chloroflexota bacterium]
MSRDFDAASPILGWMRDAMTSALDRRRLLGLASGLGLTAAGPFGRAAAAPAVVATQESTLLSSGHTWLLAAPDALRPEAPPEPSAAEIDEILDFQAKRTGETAELVARWAARPAVLPWLGLGMELTDANAPSALHENRAHAHLRTAMHDAVVAALDAQAAYARPAPAVADDRITVVEGATAVQSSFPSVHAAVAGAATTVFAYLFPDASSDGFAGLADEAATSRLWAGAAYRGDIEAGLALGRAIGELAVARAAADGSDAEWDGSRQPSGDGYYQPTPPDFVDPPFGVVAGTWATLVLPSGDAIRPAPFPAHGSSAWEAELASVRAATDGRTLAQERTIDYWLSKGPNGFYTEYARDLIERGRPVEAEAAAVLAMASVAIYDVLVAVWDAKYHYWTARPSTMDPELDLYIPNPPYPSYPGGWAAVCGAGATALAAAFPAAEADLLTSAWEGAAQRGWSGIHYVLDDDMGLLMGARVGRLVAAAVRAGAASEG